MKPKPRLPVAPLPLYRHRYERLWFWLCAAISLLAFIAAFAASAVDPQSLQNLGLSAAESRELLNDAGMMLFLPLLPLGLWVLRLMAESDIKAHTFEADDKLLPELLDKVAAYAEALGMDAPPKLYIAAGTLPEPFLKAFAPKPRLLVLPADMAVADGGQSEGLRDFYLAQQMARLRLGYSGLWRNSLLLIPRLLLLPGHALNRAETYSADALAAQLAPEYALDSLLIAVFGNALYPKIDRAHYRRSWQAASGFGFDQILSEEPLPQERYLALARQLDSPEPYPSDGRLF